MRNFTVKWMIELTAETPEDAARQALEIQRDHDSTALCFHVMDDDTMESHQIDLYNKEK